MSNNATASVKQCPMQASSPCVGAICAWWTVWDNGACALPALVNAIYSTGDDIAVGLMDIDRTMGRG